MYLKKLSIIFSLSVIIAIGSINVTYAFESVSSPKIDNDVIKSIDYLNNNMYILIKSILLDNFDSNQIKNEITFLSSLISDLNKKSNELPKDLNCIIATIKAITSFYNLSIIKAGDYIRSTDPNDLIESIHAFSIGYNTSLGFKEIYLKARK